MNIKSLTLNFANYNLWVNQKLVDWLSSKNDEQLNQEVPSSFTSILKTLNHVWAIEEYWFALITQNSDFNNRYAVQDLDRQEVFDGLLNRSTLLLGAIEAYTETELAENLKIATPWFEANKSRAEYLQHMVNHGTYHRGQVVTIARNVGITDAPLTDYIFYLASQQS